MTMNCRTLLSIAVAAFIATTTHAAQLADKVRVLSCDLASIAIETPAASAELKLLLEKANPDIVFLQHVADWETCDRICKLRPGLRVVTCSAFATEPSSQVAILARDKAALAWTDETSTGNGFAYAVLQAGSRKLGVFSIQNHDNSAAMTGRILAEITKLQQFANNRPESFVVAGAALEKAALTEATFETVASDAKSNLKKPSAEFWAANAGFIARPRSIAIAGVPASVLVTDIDTANTFSSKVAYQNALLFPGETPAPVQAVLQPSATTPKTFSITTIAGISLASLLVLALLVRRRKPSMALVPTLVNGMPSTEGQLSEPVRQNLIAWMKTILVQRLIADRRKMIADEAEATRRTLAIEQKLSELQISLQDRISGYENRIARLESELSAATFENRELIRLQISDLKEKVAKAKEQFVVHRN
jgi:hypothetical protein